jgi:hypothetical protein
LRRKELHNARVRVVWIIGSNEKAAADTIRECGPISLALALLSILEFGCEQQSCVFVVSLIAFCLFAVHVRKNRKNNNLEIDIISIRNTDHTYTTMRAILELMIRRAVFMGILLLLSVAAVIVAADVVSADAAAAAARLYDSATAVAAASPIRRSRKVSHPRLNTDINITTSLFQQKQSSQQQQNQFLSPLSAQELEEERQARKRRSLERKERMRKAFSDVPPPPTEMLQAVSQEEFQTMQQNIRLQENNEDNSNSNEQKSRQLSWFGRGSNSGISTVSETYLVDPSQAYDKWAQAYRMLGGYIDCDHKKDDDDHHSGDNNNNNNNNGDVACSRWMIWASVRLFVCCFCW